MYIQTNKLDFIKMVPMFFAILLAIAIIIFAVYFFLKKEDDKKELITQTVKVLEKPIQQGNIEWYVVECENGERMKLRSFQADHVIIAVGDVGIISYKGKTIQTFQRA
ncbi:MAG: hypothetical protein PHW34_11095 [Hespellia sp.]|nr:hypothetical protein [Hespellia sp.]MDD3404022.1 hypothetical protein [Hespellia sp.]